MGRRRRRGLLLFAAGRLQADPNRETNAPPPIDTVGSWLPPLRPDHDEPRGDDRSERTASAPRLDWYSVGRGRRRRAALRLKEIHVVRFRIDADRLRAGERRDGLDNR